MTKEEARIKLMKSGYTVVDENSVITVIIPENGNIKNTVKDVKEIFLKIGYDASFGVRQHKFADGEDLGEKLADDEEETGTENDLDADASDVVDTTEEANADEHVLNKETSEEVKLELSDMDMLLNENSVQFSLEEFGIM